MQSINNKKIVGISFQKGLGAVHGLSEPIGATFNTQHGLTNAVILPWVLKDLQIMASGNSGGTDLNIPKIILIT